jgi:hypothetical protein
MCNVKKLVGNKLLKTLQFEGRLSLALSKAAQPVTGILFER